MGKKNKKAKRKQKTKKEILSGIFWRAFPFILFFVILIYLAVLGNGYEFFEKKGWNPGIVFVIRYFDNILLTLIPFVIAIILLWFYIKAWKRWARELKETRFKNKGLEILFGSAIFLVPFSILIYISIELALTILHAPDSYWQNEWELK